MLEYKHQLELVIDQKIRYRQLRTQFALALVAGIVFAAELGAVYYHLFGTEARPIFGSVVVMMMMIAVLVPFIVWLFVSLCTFVIGRLFGARMDFGVLFRTQGWGMVPFLGTSASFAAGRFLGLRGVAVCQHPALTCDRTEYYSFVDQVEGVFAFASSATSDPMFQALYAVGILFFIVTAVLWAMISEKASTLTSAGAAIAVGIPTVGLILGWTLVTF